MGTSSAQAGSADRVASVLRGGPVRRAKRPHRNGRPRKSVPPPLPARASQSTGQIEGFPHLEPPTPLTRRMSGGFRRRGILSELWWQIPCWLASLVAHLAVLIVLASILVHYGERPALMRIFFTMGADAEQERIALETVTFVDPEHHDDDVAEQRVVAAHVEEERENGGDDISPPMLSPWALATSPEAAPAQAEPGLPGRGAVAGSLGQVVRAVAGSFGQLARPTPVRGAPDREIQDRIVDRFILYDIGRLKGTEGEKARNDFGRLGPKAIPSLVYGLNRAANIRASCPYCVISRKLDEALAENDDPAMLRYALENIGRDVPRNARYSQRLAQFRRKWARTEVAEYGRVQAEIASSGCDPNDSSVARHAREIVSGKTGELLAALSNDDPDRRLAGTIVAAVRVRSGKQPRAGLVLPLVSLLNDPDPQIRRRAHDVLVAITHDDFGPHDPNASEQDRQVAMQQWIARTLEPQAAAALARAEALQVRGRNEAAIKHYRKLINDFPGSRCAEEARRRLQVADATLQSRR